MEKITFDKRNYRKHSDENKRVIKKSLEELGAGRSVLIDKNNTLIAGNGVFEQAQALGIPVRVIETDGTELVAVKRTDIAEGDEKRKRLAMADNVASDLSEFDDDLLHEDFSMEELSDWGLESEEEIVDETQLKEILDDADFESLSDAARKSTGLEQITFLMKKEQAGIVKSCIGKVGKEELTFKIVELCRNLEAKC